MYVNDEIRQKYPGMCRKADHERSKQNAIKAFCRGCMGGSLTDVRSCPSRGCFLWPYRLGGFDESPRPVPSVDEYREMTADCPRSGFMRGDDDE